MSRNHEKFYNEKKFSFFFFQEKQIQTSFFSLSFSQGEKNSPWDFDKEKSIFLTFQIKYFFFWQ